MSSTPSEHTPHPVTGERRDELHEHGHVILRGVFSEQEIAGYRPAIRDYVLARRADMTAGERQMGASALNTLFRLSDAPELVARFVTLPRLGEIAARLLDVPAVRILHFCGFFKPGGGPATCWHQDGAFIPLDTDKILSVWIPLAEVTPQMGGLVFARGSHRHGPLDPVTAVHRFPLVRNGTLAAGDVSIHLGWTLHASQGNSTDVMREALAVSYYPDGAAIAANRHLPFARQLLNDYFAGREPGDLATGEANPIVFPVEQGDSRMSITRFPPLDATYEVAPGDIEDFRRDGHVKLQGVLRAEELAAFRPHIERVVFESPPEHHAMEQKVAGGDKNWVFINNTWRLDDVTAQFVLNRRLGRVAADLLGVDGVRLFRDQSYFKGPGGSNTPWHQDAYFMPLDTDEIITFWIPLTDITPDMAPMSYVTGSHVAGYLGTSNGDDASMDEFERQMHARGLRVFNYGSFAAGDIGVHAGMTLHSSRTNTSNRMREAMVIVYFADGATIAPEKPLSENTPPQEAFAALIRRQNRATSLPGLGPGQLAAGPMTPIVYQSAQRRD